MSSHREAPEISKDPSADNTDVYAFVTPGKPDTVTIVANYIPFQLPYGGPNFFEFDDDVVYGINISNEGDAQVDRRFEFRFTTRNRNPSFLYNTGVITTIDDPDWNRPQTYSITQIESTVRRNGGRVLRGTPRSQVVARNQPVPPVNVGVRSTPNYDALAQQAVVNKPGGMLQKVFCGQRGDAFFVDLGSIFDLGALRPFNQFHLIKLATEKGVNGLQGLNVHSIVIQVKISDLTRNGRAASDVLAPESVIGVWADATRSRSTVRQAGNGSTSRHQGGQVQVSRLGNPLFNEVITPITEKDSWNTTPPSGDRRFAKYVNKPELGGLLPVLYPGVFPNLAAFNAGGRPRADLHAILLTGIPAGVVSPNFQNYTGPIEADMLRLNMAVPPAKNPSKYGILGNDLAGFPNGRRLTDDIVAIELRAVAGATIPLVYPDYVPDANASKLTDGTSNTNLALKAEFPFLAIPAGGYQSRPGKASDTPVAP